MKFVIEHLEKELYEWCLLEYTHISEIVGKEHLLFTNITQKKKLSSLGIVRSESVTSLNLKNACILDPQAKKLLTPQDKFDVYIFGGILGNHPMDGRTTREFKTIRGERRNIGNLQMSTDTAVIVTKRILDGTPFSKLRFQDTLEIEIEPDFHNILPYRYLIEDNTVVLPSGFIEFLKKQEDNQ